MIEILDSKLCKIDILRKYTFAQYTEKFRGIGTFQIKARLVEENLYLLDEAQEYYVLFDGVSFGKIETRKKDSDSEHDKTIDLQGKMSLSIFSQRVLAGTYKLNGKTPDVLYELVNNKMCDTPENPSFMDIIITFDDIERLDSLASTVSREVTGGYLWDIMLELLEQDGFGLYFTPIVLPQHTANYPPYLSTNISSWKLVISAGKDKRKSIGESAVVFSQSLSNIARTSYEHDISDFKDVAYIAGEGEAESRKWYEISATEDTKIGWNRNELWIDARDIQSETENTTLTEAQYEELIRQRANEKFAENSIKKSYTSTITEANTQYSYGVDYKLGDWATVIDNELGIEIDVQITEVTKSIEGVREITDIEFTYGSIRKDITEQIGGITGTTEKNSNDIKYLENKITQINKDLSYRLLNAGGNHNWYYHQWSDGTLEAWRCADEPSQLTFNNSYGNWYYTNAIYWNTVDPIVPFIKLENIQIGINKKGANGLMFVVIGNAALDKGTISFSFSAVNPINVTTSASIQVHIIGRWK